MKQTFFLFLFLLLLPLFTCQASDEAKSGLLDLRQWDFANEIAPLTTTWEFYQGASSLEDLKQPNMQKTLVTLPHIWREKDIPAQGYAAYSITVLLPEAPQNLLLRLSEVGSAYQLYLDGELVATRGTFATNAETAKPASKLAYIHLGKTHQNKITLVLFVSNFHHYLGGMKRAPTLGLFKVVSDQKTKALIIELFVFSTIAFMGLYHFTLFWVRPKDSFPLYFSLVCIAASGRIMLMGEQIYTYILPDISGSLQVSLRVVVSLWGIPLFISYARSLFLPQLSKTFEQIFYSIAAILTLATIALPGHIGTLSIPIYQSSILLALPYILFLLFRVKQGNSFGKNIFLGGSLILVATVVNDILYFKGFVHTGYHLPLGFLVFLISQALIMGALFSNAIRTSEDFSKEKSELAEKLNDVNLYLEANIEERTKELQDSEERYRHLIDLSPLATLSSQNGKIIFSNQAAANLGGVVSPKELEGKSLLDFIPAEERMKVNDQIISLLSKNKVTHVVEQKIQPLGSNPIIAEINSAPIKINNLPALLTVIRDISEQKKYEDTLKSAKLIAEDALRVKSEFLATMSHELRTPLNGVIAMSFYLQETDLDQDQKESVDIISNSAEHLLSIINDILDFSKLEANKSKLKITNFHFKSFLSECINHFNIAAMNKGLELSFSLMEQVPEWVYCDQKKLRQVLDNLLSNAIKFTPEGSVTLTVQHSDNLANHLKFIVQDTGIGIPEEKLTAIFLPFEQVDRSATRSFEGTGLGLAICQHFVTLLGGNITVSSSPNQGSSFFFDLPYVQGEEPLGTVHLKDKQVPDFSDKRLLIVEDNHVNKEILLKVLAKTNCTCEVAKHGLEAIELLKKEEFDCILMDLQMPIMGGLEATSIIRAGEQGVLNPKVPILAVTANAQEVDKEKCLAVGMDDYVAKPYTKETLLAAIAKLI